jgi:hypothetical protein
MVRRSPDVLLFDLDMPEASRRSPDSSPSASRPSRRHVSNILTKLDLRDRVQAALFAGRDEATDRP